MKRFLKLLFLFPLALLAVAVAVANRHPVVIYLDPFAGPAPEGTEITVQLFVVLGVAIMIGVIFGGTVTYLEQGRHRRAARLARREAELLPGGTRAAIACPGGRKTKDAVAFPWNARGDRRSWPEAPAKTSR